MLPVTGFILVRLLFKEFLSLLVSLGTWQASLYTYTIRCYSVANPFQCPKFSLALSVKYGSIMS